MRSEANLGGRPREQAFFVAAGSRVARVWAWLVRMFLDSRAWRNPMIAFRQQFSISAITVRSRISRP